MIVQCGECKSRFNLDQPLVRPSGTKVRCGLCGHVFVVYPSAKGPGGEAEKALDDISEKQLPDLKGAQETQPKGPPPERKDLLDEIFEEKEKVLAPEAMRPKEMKGPEPETRVLPAKKKRSPWPVILLSLLLLSLAGIAYVFLYTSGQGIADIKGLFMTFMPNKPSPDTGAKRLSIFDVSGKFVKSQNSGTLFVVRGKVKNRYPERISHILVRVNLLDSQGNVVRQQNGYAGNILSDSELELGDMEIINAKMSNKSGDNDSNIDIEPNAEREFMIVFGNIPPNLSEFTVQALESKVGKPAM